MLQINTDISFLREASRYSEAIQLSDVQECPICFTDKPEHDFVRISQCCDQSFCKACFQDYIQAHISDFNIMNIKCPEQTCSGVLTTEILQETLDAKTFQKYQALLVKKLSHQSQSANICPQPGCSKIFTPIEGASHTNCQCGAMICNACGGLSHEGKSCVAALDPEFEAYAAENDLKFCIMCKTVVARVEGCTHITCPICDYEWCWVCGREHSNVHEPQCPKEWSPLPPFSIMQEMGKKEKSKKLKDRILRILLIILVEAIFWPYKCLNFVEELRSPNHGWDHKVKVVVGALMFHLVYLINFGSLLFLLIEFPEKTAQLLPYVVTIGCLPWVLRLIYLAFFKGRFNKKRWQSRNAKKFNYTSAMKPEKSDQAIQKEKELEAAKNDAAATVVVVVRN